MKLELGRGKNKVFIIAEAGVNHDGKLAAAKKLVDVAAWAKADAVKFQTFYTEENQSSFHQPKTLLKACKDYELSYKEFVELAAYCKKKKIIFLSTPFEERSADFLDKINVPAYKIPSGEITNHPLLEHIARTGRPIILSTGMSRIAEIKTSIDVLKRAYRNTRLRKTGISMAYGKTIPVVVLHCVSEYPTGYDHINLLGMFELYRAFGLPVGLSDHSLGIEVPIAAVALGACVIEKHFTFDKTLKTADHGMSLDPQELKQMVDSIRNIEQALGSGTRKVSTAESALRRIARKSIVAKTALKRGTVIKRDLLLCMRPGGGIPPTDLRKLLGRTVKRDLKKDEMLKWTDLGQAKK